MASMAINHLLLYALFHATNPRDSIVAYGHAMTIDLVYTIADTSIGYIASGPAFENAGVSVPISRGSPPLLISR
jgi:hypothetical protein